MPESCIFNDHDAELRRREEDWFALFESRCCLVTSWSETSLAEKLAGGRKYSLRHTVSVVLRVLRICRAPYQFALNGIDLLPYDIVVDATGSVQVIGVFNSQLHVPTTTKSDARLTNPRWL